MRSSQPGEGEALIHSISSDTGFSEMNLDFCDIHRHCLLGVVPGSAQKVRRPISPALTLALTVQETLPRSPSLFASIFYL